MKILPEKSVSVIIPTYNREKFVKEAVESVLKSSFTDYEIIVVDDGSTDNTYKTLSCFFPKIRYVFQQHQGVSLARNRGISLSRGEWIAFLDSDDLWKPDKLKIQMETIRRESCFKICYTEEVWIKNGKFINPGKKHAKYSGWIYPFCLPLCIISCSSVIIHRSVFEEVGGFDPRLPAAEDYDLWLRITSRFPVKLISKKLIVKRGGHPDQLSKKYWGMDRFRIFSLEKMVKENSLPLAWRIATLREIARKAQIVASGARKREKWEEYRFYSYKAKTAEKEASFLLSQL